MIMRTYDTKCPKCGNTQKFQSIKGLTIKSRKKCVYCGKSYNVRDCLI
ncbi:MAG: hypothetical protein ACMXYL_01165 [Candidatus Woesearchaeota archaeon]